VWPAKNEQKKAINIWEKGCGKSTVAQEVPVIVDIASGESGHARLPVGVTGFD
jgi:hypothetical protein